MDKSIKDEDIEFDRFDWKKIMSDAWSKILGSDIKVKQRMPKPLEVNDAVTKKQKTIVKRETETKKIVQRRFNMSMKKLKSHHRNG